MTITIHPSTPREDGQVRDKIAREAEKIRKLLRQPLHKQEMHPLVQQTFNLFKSFEPNQDGLLEPRNRQSLDVQVSPGSLDRALGIMDSIIKALEGSGHRVVLKDSGTAVEVSETVLHFGIAEETKRRFKEPREHDLSGWYQFGHSQYSERRFPAGNLCLEIKPASWLGSYRTHWRDTDSKRVEDTLDSFLKGLLKIAALLEKKMRDGTESKE